MWTDIISNVEECLAVMPWLFSNMERYLVVMWKNIFKESGECSIILRVILK